MASSPASRRGLRGRRWPRQRRSVTQAWALGTGPVPRGTTPRAGGGADPARAATCWAGPGLGWAGPGRAGPGRAWAARWPRPGAQQLVSLQGLHASTMRRFLRSGHDPARERLKRDLFQFNKVRHGRQQVLSERGVSGLPRLAGCSRPLPDGGPSWALPTASGNVALETGFDSRAPPPMGRAVGCPGVGIPCPKPLIGLAVGRACKSPGLFRPRFPHL